MQGSAMNADVGDSPTPGNLLDEFEDAFQNCLAPLIKEDILNGPNQEELKAAAEANTQKFFDYAYKLESAFLQKRFLLSFQKPEVLINEENLELRVEIHNKDELIKRHTEKVTEWQKVLNDIITRVGSATNHSSRVSAQFQQGTPMSIMPQVPQVSPIPQSSLMNNMNHCGVTSNMNTSMGMQQSMMGQVSGTPPVPINQGYQNIPNIGSPQHGMGHMSSGNGSTGPNMGPNGSMGMMGPGPMFSNAGMVPQGGLQGPLAYLEKTTTNIGMPELRR